jgi:hypothetical protein
LLERAAAPPALTLARCRGLILLVVLITANLLSCAHGPALSTMV